MVAKTPPPNRTLRGLPMQLRGTETMTRSFALSTLPAAPAHGSSPRSPSLRTREMILPWLLRVSVR